MSNINKKVMSRVQTLFPEAIYSFHRALHEIWANYAYRGDNEEKIVSISASLFSKHTRTFHWLAVSDWELTPSDIGIILDWIGKNPLIWEGFKKNLTAGHALSHIHKAIKDISIFLVTPPTNDQEFATVSRHLYSLYEGYHHNPSLYLDGIIYRNLKKLHKDEKSRKGKVDYYYGKFFEGQQWKKEGEKGTHVEFRWKKSRKAKVDYYYGKFFEGQQWKKEGKKGTHVEFRWINVTFIGTENKVQRTELKIDSYQSQELDQPGIAKKDDIPYLTDKNKAIIDCRPGWDIAKLLNNRIFFKGNVQEIILESDSHILTIPLYDVWIGTEAWGSLCGNLLLFFKNGIDLGGFMGRRQISLGCGSPPLDIFRDKCQQLSQEFTKSGTLMLLKEPIEPPYDLVKHFVKNLNILQDWERIIVYDEGKPQYSYHWEGKIQIEKGEPEWKQNEWKRCDCVSSTLGNVSCDKCPSWEEVELDEDGKYLRWEYDFWDSSFLPDISDEEKNTFHGRRLAFEYPITACIPDDDRREALGDEYIRQQLVVLRGLILKVRARRAALRSAVSAIMGRNMSHNIGSHVLARYSSVIKKDLKPACKEKTDHRTDFLNYLQRRMDFLAEVATSDKAFWEQPLSLKDSLSRLNYDTQEKRFATNCEKPNTPIDTECSECKRLLNPSKEKKVEDEKCNKPILLSYITGKESLIASVEWGSPPNEKKEEEPSPSDRFFSCPGGEVGVHALYVILENIIRNSARHAKSDKKDEKVKVFVSVSDGSDAKDNLIKLTIIDPRTKLDKDGCVVEENNETEVKSLTDRINYILTKEPFLNEDGSTNPKYWGVREMQICANYLRGFPLGDLEGMPESPLVLKAEPWEHKNNGVTEYYLSYTLYLKQAQLLAYIEDSSQSEKNTDRDKELLIRGIKPIYREKGYKEDNNGVVDWQKIANESRGYSFLVLTPDLMSEYEKKLQPEAAVENNGERPEHENEANETLLKMDFKHALPVRIVKINDDIEKLLNNLMPNNKEANVAANGGLTEQSQQPSEPVKKVDLWSLHEAMLQKYRNRDGWRVGGVYATVGWDDTYPIPSSSNGSTQSLPLHHVLLSGTNSLFNSLPGDLRYTEPPHTYVGLAWLDHPNNFDLMMTDNATTAAASINVGPRYRNWASVEPMWSDSTHKQILLNAMQNDQSDGMHELAAAAFARVVVLDERIQSRRHDKVRSVTLYKYWPQVGIWCPLHPDEVTTGKIDGLEMDVIVKNGNTYYAYHNKEVACNLDKPDFAKIHDFLNNPTKLAYQCPADFLVLHLTILERLNKQEGDKNIDDTLLKLVQDTQCAMAQIIIVTGRGVPTVARHREGEAHINARYLPISALQEFLVTRPSKLGLMRVLWAAAAPGKQS